MKNNSLIKQIDDLIFAPEEEIAWIGSADGKFAMDWEEFSFRFSQLNHDPEDAKQELAVDLVIVMKDHSWYERNLNDGGWIHKHVPYLAINHQPFKYVSESDSPNGSWPWSTLEELNDVEEVAQ
ncbi:hypothetical protein DKZ23_06270 [Limosilactobacillus reuteri]|uniref:Uncharacterized protein n=1 Tax=Limosilactobacillus reuteri TaxID=1598 RepID=A0A317GGZ8_LIMRT|nr:hypothetical protein [Limosilactobacillus reuteri]MBV0920990.1 hypothetical protein [Limosilactobacillus reuteri]MCH5385953.1 hypothetical protein [Limosilactobacillus reuteri]PWT46420.1 hypothetical protein DKZ23_06270 [Limosilactobacillus reuteri]PWT50955.1 hypothetical protein DKZ33_06165 [Limosilactobacillus reuteri]PWT61172.1 hypothetical protein DKZ32_08645 [Limosilactobacillus reuteri]